MLLYIARNKYYLEGLEIHSIFYYSLDYELSILVADYLRARHFLTVGASDFFSGPYSECLRMRHCGCVSVCACACACPNFIIFRPFHRLQLYF